MSLVCATSAGAFRFATALIEVFGGVNTCADDFFTGAFFAGDFAAGVCFAGVFLRAKGSTISMRSIALRQSEGVLRHVVEDHFSAQRSGLMYARNEPKICEAVFKSKPVAAVNLYGLVECPQ